MSRELNLTPAATIQLPFSHEFASKYLNASLQQNVNQKTV